MYASLWHSHQQAGMTFRRNDCTLKYLHFPRCLLQITTGINIESKWAELQKYHIWHTVLR